MFSKCYCVSGTGLDAEDSEVPTLTEPTFCPEAQVPREHYHYWGLNKSTSHPSLWATSRIQNHLNGLE